MSPYKCLFLLLSLSMLMACKKEKKQKLPSVEALVAQNIEEFKQDMLKECHKDAIIEANRLVDSTLLANAKLKKAFATDKPPVPVKPIKPEPLQPIDSSAVEPILNLSVEEQDSLNQLKLDIEDDPDTIKPDSLKKKKTKGEDF